jgi:trans-aconitate 2-methyltransferase
MPSPAAGSASDYFASMADAYDSLIRRAVPPYEAMTGRLLDYLPARAGRVLELGCGTGNLTLRLARRYPEARVTYVDAAPEMTSLTGARLASADSPAGRGDRFTPVTRRFEELEFGPRAFDLVTSCISLHHVSDKAALYRRVRSWLAPGGTFRFADQVRGGTEGNHRINWDGWLEFCRRPGNCTEEEIGGLVGHAHAHDHYTPLVEHFRLLADAGFEPATLDCVWRELMWGIVTAEAR